MDSCSMTSIVPDPNQEKLFLLIKSEAQDCTFVLLSSPKLSRHRVLSRGGISFLAPFGVLKFAELEIKTETA
jgi:hypothetical protein